jgi:hypothetical protein
MNFLSVTSLKFTTYLAVGRRSQSLRLAARRDRPNADFFSELSETDPDLAQYFYYGLRRWGAVHFG